MNIPNVISCLRLAATPCTIISIIYSPPHYRWLPLVIFLCAAFTDAIDGYIARHFNMQTRLGNFLDPLADKTLILSTLITLQFASGYEIKMPLWVLIIIVSKDILIIMWLFISLMMRSDIVIEPNILGKITSGLQMVLVAFLLYEFVYAKYVWWAVAILTVGSSISYARREIRRMQMIGEEIK